MPCLKTRSRQKEIFDLESPSQEESFEAYRLIRLVNRYLGGTRVILSHLKEFSKSWKPSDPVRILDVGAGIGDIPQAIVQWSRSKGYRVKIVALDISHPSLVLAQREISTYPEISLIQADILGMPLRQESFDYVISSLLFHHLKDEDIPRVLKAFDALARRGIIVNDLMRRWKAYLGIFFLTRFTQNRVFRHDAPLSVLRGFRKKEVETLIQKAGLPYLEFQSHFAYRFAIVGEKPA
jgi:SAM-dependent methyltransferase